MPHQVCHHPAAPGVTEIRVHGVGGSSPQQLLEQTGVQQVTGDGTAGLYRGAVGSETRTVEAYSWGGLTARARNRAFWVLLLPFALINLAGWMVEPNAGEGVRPSPATRWHEGVVMIIGCVTTAMYVMWAALVTMDVAAFQCGAMIECVQGRWYLEFLQSEFFRGHVGRRLVVGMTLPLGLLALFVWLGRSTRSVYDEYGETVGDDFSELPSDCPSSLCLPRFWFTSHWQAQASRLHTAGALAVLGGVLAGATANLHTRYATGISPVPGWTLFFVAVAVVLAVLATLAAMAARYQPPMQLRGQAVDIAARSLWWAGLGITVAAAGLAWLLEVPDPQLAPVVLDRPRATAVHLWGFAWAPVLLLWAAIGLVGAFSVIQVWRWVGGPNLFLDQFLVALMIALLILWPLGAVVPAVALVGIGAVVLQRRLWRRGDVVRKTHGSGLALTTIVLAAGLQAVSAGWPQLWGGSGSRLSPLLLFTLVLMATTAWRARGWPVRWYVLSLTTVVLVAGALLAIGLGTDRWFEAAAGLAFVVVSMLWLARFDDPVYRGFRWNGPAAVALVALSLIGGAFSGGTMRLVDVLDGDGTSFVVQSTRIYEWITLGFSGALTAAAVAAAAWYGYVWVAEIRSARRRAVGRLSGLEQAAAPIGRCVARLEVTAKAVCGGDVLVTILAMLMLGGWLSHNLRLFQVHGARFRSWIDDGPPASWDLLVQMAAWIALAVAVAAFLAIRRSMRDAEFRTKIGIVWDVTSFWPRNFHPFAPPAYAVRAVPELQARAGEIVERGGKLILSGHSQGSIVSLAAAGSLPPEVQRNVWLITHGSPLGRFYSTFFPRYFTDAMLVQTGRALGGSCGVRDGSWINFYRLTDPIAAPVLTHTSVLDPAELSAPRALADHLRLHCGEAAVAGLPDVLLQDPFVETRLPHRPSPTPLGHSGYLNDPAMRGTLDVLTAVSISSCSGRGDASTPADRRP